MNWQEAAILGHLALLSKAAGVDNRLKLLGPHRGMLSKWFDVTIKDGATIYLRVNE